MGIIYLFIYFWLCWVFASVRGLSLVAASGGHSSSRCAGLSLSRPLLLRSTGSRRAGSVIVAHGLSRSTARGIFPDQGSNPCPLHWQADSHPLRHQGSPPMYACRSQPRDYPWREWWLKGDMRGFWSVGNFVSCSDHWIYGCVSLLNIYWVEFFCTMVYIKKSVFFF